MQMKTTGAHRPTVGASSPSVADGDATGAVLTSACPRRRSDVRARAIEGEVVLLDRQRQLVHQLNQTGTYIWDRCDGVQSVAMIARDVAEAFDVDAEQAENDVVNAVRQLEVAGLVDLARMPTQGERRTA